jgi:hypothetical protein
VNVTSRLEEMKNFNTDRASLDEMLLIEDDMNRLRARYENRTLPVPEWLTDQLTTVNTETSRRTRDDLEKRLKELNAADAALLTQAEKRDRIAREREAIMSRLKDANQPQPV